MTTTIDVEVHTSIDRPRLEVAAFCCDPDTVTAWQETYGTQTQKVTVAAGQSATANFAFEAK